MYIGISVPLDEPFCVSFDVSFDGPLLVIELLNISYKVIYYLNIF